MRSVFYAVAVALALLICNPAAAASDKNERSPDDSQGSKSQPSKPKPAAPPPRVEIGQLQFVGGEVKLIVEMLAKTREPVGRCVADHGGLRSKDGSIEVQFLVRVRGRAEGVEVLSLKGVHKKAGRCVRKFLKNRWIGTPSDDPVGVTLRYGLSRVRGKAKVRRSASKPSRRKRR